MIRLRKEITSRASFGGQHLPAATRPEHSPDSDPADASAACKPPASDPAKRRCRAPSTSNPTSARPLPPVDLRTGHRFIGKRMVPRPDDGLHRRLRLHQHVRNVVTISVEQAANQKTRNFDLPQRKHRTPPERPIMLMLQINQRPRRRIKLRAQNFFVERVVRCPVSPCAMSMFSSNSSTCAMPSM